MPWCLQRRFIDADVAALTAAHGVVDETRGVVVFNRHVTLGCALITPFVPFFFTLHALG